MLNDSQLAALRALVGYALEQDHDLPDWAPGEYLYETFGTSAYELEQILEQLSREPEPSPALPSSSPSEPEPRAAFSSYVSAARDLSENLPDSLPMTDDIRTPSDADAVLETFEQHAAALRRERTAPVWVVPAPWEGPTLELEPAPSVYGPVPDTFEQLGELGLDLSSERDTAELARLMLAAGALYAHDKGSLSQCMRTAVLWERG